MAKSFKELKKDILNGQLHDVIYDFGPMSCEDFVMLYNTVKNIKD